MAQQEKLPKYNYALGRRKTAVATVRLFSGEGKIEINGKDFKDYYPGELDRKYVLYPLDILNKRKDFYFTVQVKGSGSKKQRDAIRMALARALVEYDPALKPDLKKANLLTRDDRMVERKKTGLRKARKAPQFSKR